MTEGQLSSMLLKSLVLNIRYSGIWSRSLDQETFDDGIEAVWPPVVKRSCCVLQEFIILRVIIRSQEDVSVDYGRWVQITCNGSNPRNGLFCIYVSVAYLWIVRMAEERKRTKPGYNDLYSQRNFSCKDFDASWSRRSPCQKAVTYWLPPALSGCWGLCQRDESTGSSVPLHFQPCAWGNPSPGTLYPPTNTWRKFAVGVFIIFQINWSSASVEICARLAPIDSQNAAASFQFFLAVLLK